MVKTRGQARQKQRDEGPTAVRKTEAIPGEEDSTLARWPPPAPCSKFRRGPRGGGRAKDEAVDWAGLPDSCLLSVFESLYAHKSIHAVRQSLAWCYCLAAVAMAMSQALLPPLQLVLRDFASLFRNLCRCTTPQLCAQHGGRLSWRLHWEILHSQGQRGTQCGVKSSRVIQNRFVSLSVRTAALLPYTHVLCVCNASA